MRKIRKGYNLKIACFVIIICLSKTSAGLPLSSLRNNLIFDGVGKEEIADRMEDVLSFIEKKEDSILTFDSIGDLILAIEGIKKEQQEKVLVLPCFGEPWTNKSYDWDELLSILKDRWATRNSHMNSIGKPSAALSIIEKDKKKIYSLLLSEGKKGRVHPEPINGWSYATHGCSVEKGIGIVKDGFFQIPWRLTLWEGQNSTGDVGIVFKLPNSFCIQYGDLLALDLTDDLRVKLPIELRDKLKQEKLLLSADEFNFLLYIDPSMIDIEKTLDGINKREKGRTFPRRTDMTKKLALLKNLLKSRLENRTSILLKIDQKFPSKVLRVSF